VLIIIHSYLPDILPIDKDFVVRSHCPTYPPKWAPRECPSCKKKIRNFS